MKPNTNIPTVGSFESGAARRSLQLASFGFLAGLGFIPGCERLFGFTGFFGFVGVAFIIELFYQVKQRRRA